MILHSPSVVRARAGLIATEQGLCGLAAGLCLALGLTLAYAPNAPLSLIEPGLWCALVAGALGLAVTVVGRVLEIGEAPRRTPILHAQFLPLAAGALLLTAGAGLSLATAGTDGQLSSPARIWLWSAAAPSIAVLIALSLRSKAATQCDDAVSELSQPIGHALLGGMAALLAIGLITGHISATNTYLVGAAVTALAAATILATSLCVRRARSRLHAAQRDGGRFPLAEQAYRMAAIATVVGLLLPSVVVVADLLAARLTLLVLATAALAVSNHALRYALVACHLALPRDRV